MLIRGSKRPRYPGAREWKYLGKQSSLPSFVPGGINIGASSQVTIDSSGVAITLRGQQAIRIRRFTSSLTYPTNDNVLFVLWGEFGYEVPPFGLGSGQVVMPTMNEISVPTAAQAAAAVDQGVKLSNVGVDFQLVDDWLEYDDLAGHLESGVPVQSFTRLQLRTHWVIFNTSAVAKVVQLADSAIWDLFELPQLLGAQAI